MPGRDKMHVDGMYCGRICLLCCGVTNCEIWVQIPSLLMMLRYML